MAWRLQQFSQKQGYSIVNQNKKDINRYNRQEIHPYIMEKYHEYEAQLVRYWGGGKYYKKMGRMDKVRYK